MVKAYTSQLSDDDAKALFDDISGRQLNEELTTLKGDQHQAHGETHKVRQYCRYWAHPRTNRENRSLRLKQASAPERGFFLPLPCQLLDSAHRA